MHDYERLLGDSFTTLRLQTNNEDETEREITQITPGQLKLQLSKRKIPHFSKRPKGVLEAKFWRLNVD